MHLCLYNLLSRGKEKKENNIQSIIFKKKKIKEILAKLRFLYLLAKLINASLPVHCTHCLQQYFICEGDQMFSDRRKRGIFQRAHLATICDTRLSFNAGLTILPWKNCQSRLETPQIRDASSTGQWTKSPPEVEVLPGKRIQRLWLNLFLNFRE